MDSPELEEIRKHIRIVILIDTLLTIPTIIAEFVFLCYLTIITKHGEQIPNPMLWVVLVALAALHLTALYQLKMALKETQIDEADEKARNFMVITIILFIAIPFVPLACFTHLKTNAFPYLHIYFIYFALFQIWVISNVRKFTCKICPTARGVTLGTEQRFALPLLALNTEEACGTSKNIGNAIKNGTVQEINLGDIKIQN